MPPDNGMTTSTACAICNHSQLDHLVGLPPEPLGWCQVYGCECRQYVPRDGH